jgi:phage baseplate assembly protein W
MQEPWYEDPIGTDLDPAGRVGVLVGGAANLAGALLRRLNCPRGYLPHRPGYGSLLHRFIGQPFDVATALAVRGEVERTLLEDDRLLRVVSMSVSAEESLDAFWVVVQVESVLGVVDVAGSVTAEVRA